MATNYSIDKLNANNYFNWSTDIKYVLLDKDLWGIVSEEETKPVVNVEAGINEGFVRKFNVRAKQAVSTICLNIEPEFRKIVEKLEDPVVIWKELKKYFLPDNRSRHMALFTELCNAKIQKDESISIFSARLMRIATQIKEADPNFNDKYVVFQLIRYLPSRFDLVVQQLLQISESEFNYKNVLNSLVAEESRLELREKDNQQRYYTEVSYVNDPSHRQTSPGSYHRQTSPGSYHRHTSPGSYHRQTSPGSYHRQTSPGSCHRQTSPGPYHHQTSPSSYQQQYSRSPNSSPQRTPSYPAYQSQSYQPRWRPPQRWINYNSYSSGRYRSNSNSFSRGKRNHHSGKSISNQFLSHSSFIEGSESDWVFDTAASHNFCKDRDLFVDFQNVNDEHMLIAVEDATFPIEGRGTIKLKFGPRYLYLENTLYAPNLRKNLISGPRLDKMGAHFIGRKGEVKVYAPNNELLFKAFLKGNVYYAYPQTPKCLKGKVRFANTSIKSPKQANIKIWHNRLAHVCPSLMSRTGKFNAAAGLPVFKEQVINCEPCKLSKQRRKSFKPLNYTKSKQPLQILYSDVWGPCRVRGNQGERYFVSIIDDFSKKTTVYPIHEKSEVPQVLTQHIVRNERFLGLKVKTLRTDNGREFVNNEMANFCAVTGITHEKSNVYTPEQCGVIERYNQTIMNGVRTVLKESGLPNKFWSEAALYFTYTWNRVCHSGMEKTPIELYSGYKPSVRQLKPFGCVAYVGVPAQKRSKLESRAIKGYMLGYALKTKGYRLWLPSSNEIVETINVSFDETTFFKSNRSGAVIGPNTYTTPRHGEEDPEEVEEENLNPPSPIPGPSFAPNDDYFESDEEGESSEDTTSQVKVSWLRKAVSRKVGKRIDIYYFDNTNKSNRLRSINDVDKYCRKNNIHFQKELFDFSPSNTFTGIVNQDNQQPSTEEEELSDEEDAGANLTNL